MTQKNALHGVVLCFKPNKRSTTGTNQEHHPLKQKESTAIGIERRTENDQPKRQQPGTSLTTNEYEKNVGVEQMLCKHAE
jgi:hypothetical protein